MEVRTATRPSSGVSYSRCASLSTSLNSLFQKSTQKQERPPISPRNPIQRLPGEHPTTGQPTRTQSQQFSRPDVKGLAGLFSPLRPNSAKTPFTVGQSPTTPLQPTPSPTKPRPPTAPTSFGGSFTLNGITGHGVGGTSGSQAFHRGVVNALGDVLKQQRKNGDRLTDLAAEEANPPKVVASVATPRPPSSKTGRPAPAQISGSSERILECPPLRPLHKPLVEASCNERERREKLVSQKRSEWVEQRWSATTRDRRRNREREMKLDLLAKSDNIANLPQTGIRQSRSSSMRELIDFSEQSARKDIESAEAEAFDLLVRCTTMLKSRQALRVSAPNDPRPSTSSNVARMRRDQIVSLEQLRQEGNTAYQQRKFVTAHTFYGRVVDGALSCVAISSPQERTAVRELHALALLNRAATGLALLNYDSCITDGLDAIRHLESPIVTPGNIPSSPSDTLIKVKAWLRVAKAYTLSEAYRSAEEAYGQAITLSTNPCNDEMRELIERAQVEKGSLAALQRAKSACQTENFKEACALFKTVDSTTGTQAFISEAPIRLAALNAEAHHSPSTARLECTKYLSALLQIAEQCELKIGKKEEATPTQLPTNSLLLANFSRHLCDTLVVVAKAAFFSGQLYVNIAHQKLILCLSIRHDHRGALALKKQVDHYERQMDTATTHVQKGGTGAALDILTALLATVSKLSGPLIAAVALARSELFLKLNNIPSAISDASLAIDAEPTCQRAFATRSRLFQAIGNYDSALRDLSTAAALAGKDGPTNPYHEDLETLREACREDASSFANFSSRCNSARPRTSNSNSQRNTSASPRGVSSARAGKRGAYTKLGLAPTATVTEVKNAYKKLVLTCHPDKFVDASANIKEEKLITFKEISKAYAEIMELEVQPFAL